MTKRETNSNKSNIYIYIYIYIQYFILYIITTTFQFTKIKIEIKKSETNDSCLHLKDGKPFQPKIRRTKMHQQIFWELGTRIYNSQNCMTFPFFESKF